MSCARRPLSWPGPLETARPGLAALSVQSTPWSLDFCCPWSVLLGRTPCPISLGTAGRARTRRAGRRRARTRRAYRRTPVRVSSNRAPRTLGCPVHQHARTDLPERTPGGSCSVTPAFPTPWSSCPSRWNTQPAPASCSRLRPLTPGPACLVRFALRPARVEPVKEPGSTPTPLFPTPSLPVVSPRSEGGGQTLGGVLSGVGWTAARGPLGWPANGEGARPLTPLSPLRPPGGGSGGTRPGEVPKV